MKVRTRKLVSILCALALVVGLVPMTVSAEFMPGEVAEIPAGDEVGVIPALETSLDDGWAGEETTELLAASDDYVHNVTEKGTTSTFYTFQVSAVDYPGKNIKLTGDYAGYKKGVLVRADGDVAFTAPSNGKLRVTIVRDATSSGTLRVSYVNASNKDVTNKPQMPANPCVMEVSVDSGVKYSLGGNNGDMYILKLEFVPDIPSCDVHPWTEEDWVEENPASCTEPGLEVRVCSVCGERDTREIPAKGHTPVSFAQVDPTCNEPGTTAGTRCSVCEELLSGGETIPATGDHKDGNNDGACDTCDKVMPTAHEHDFSILVSNTATCTSSGVKTMRCSWPNCDKTDSQNVPALGHDFKDVVSKRATCTTIGWTAHRACSRCDAKENYTEIPATGHDFDPVTRECKNGCGTVMDSAGMTAGGWFETLYAEIDGITDAQVAQVVYQGPVSGSLRDADLEYLVRDAKLSSGKSGVRIDIPGLPAGSYSLLVMTNSGMPYTATNIEVKEYDRSGYAHYNYSEGVGAYRDDGIPKENATIIYVTEENKNRISVTTSDGTTVSGIGNILNSVGQDTGGGTTSKGGKPNTNQGVLKKLALDDSPLIVRIVGTVHGGGGQNPGTPIEGLTAYDSIDYGGTVGDNGFMARMADCQNITIEGIGPDACIYGWGLHVICNTDSYNEYGLGKNFEFRNLTFMEVPEDCIGLEGQQEGGQITAPVRRGWVHNCDFYPAHISSPAESDKADGDGSMDFKRGEYFTLSYCYFEGAHKTNLIGSADDSLQYHITWHHNHWVNCKARGPLVRNSNIHIYNCWYENQTDYAMNPRADAYIFSEYNTFSNCKNPRRVESTNGVKSYMDGMGSFINENGATVVADKSQEVSSACKYANFDTNAAICYIPSGDYKLDQSNAAARAKIQAYTGPMKPISEMVEAEELSGLLVDDAHMPKAPVSLPYTKSNFSDVSGSTTWENIVYSGGSPSSGGYKFSKSTTGRNVVFTVDEPVNITISGSGINLISAESGDAVIRGSGSAKSLPAGTYFVQPAEFQPGDATGAGFSFKDGTLNSLDIQSATPPHTHSYTVVSRTEPTCTKEGVILKKCPADGATATETIPKIDHHYVDGVCDMCGLKQGVYDPDADGSVPPTPPVLVRVTGVSVDVERISVDQYSTYKLTATVEPADATTTSVTWTSDDPTVATVTAAGGLVTGKESGTTTITVTTKDGGYTASCVVDVIGITETKKKFLASAYSGKSHDGAVTAADVTEIETETKNAFTLTAAAGTWRISNSALYLVLAPKEGNAMEFTITNPVNTVKIGASSTGSSNYSVIALLNQDGQRVANSNGETVKAVKGTTASSITFNNLPVGTYRIVTPIVTAAEVGGGASGFESRGVGIHSVLITEIEREDDDRVLVSSVTLSGPNTVEMGQHITLTATVLPGDATTPTLRWSSNNTRVATVSGGVVTGAYPGTAIITAAATDGSGKKDTMTITVTPAIVDRGNLGETGNDVLWTLDREGKLAVTNTENRIAGDDLILVALWGENNRFAGVKTVKASQLEAELGTAWDHAKLIWLNGQNVPKCEAVEANLNNA